MSKRALVVLSPLFFVTSSFAQSAVEGTSAQSEWPASQSHFGEGMVIDGDYAFIAAPNEEIQRGVVYAYRNVGGTWSQVQRIVVSDNGDHVTEMAVSDGVLFLGARDHDGTSIDSGAVYVLELQGSDWVSTQRIDAPVPSNYAQFGYALDADGGVLVVGARSHSVDGGHAYAYRKQGGVWTLEATLDAPDPVVGDRFGTSIAIDGDVVVVGAYAGTLNGTRGGSAYVFRYASGSWSYEAELGAADEAAFARFGISVDVEGDRILCGAYAFGPSEWGKAYVFERVAGTWTQTAELSASTQSQYSRFGYRVQLHGDQAYVGHAGAVDQMSSGSSQVFGTVWGFELVAGTWRQTQRLLPVQIGTQSDFGLAFAIDGSQMVVGSPLHFVGSIPHAGRAWFYELQSNLSALCAGDETTGTCPCGNYSPNGYSRGCRWSTGQGGRLVPLGRASIANDTLRLSGGQMSNSSVLFFQGTSAVNSGLGSSFGDGLRCAGGAIRRLGSLSALDGMAQVPSVTLPSPLSVSGSVVAGDVRYYQAWFRNANAFCTASTFNLTNALRIEWQP